MASRTGLVRYRRSHFAPVAEHLETRRLLSFAASMAGVPQAVQDSQYTAYVHRTGTQGASSETFHFDDGAGSSYTILNPAVVQAQGHIYRTPDTITGKAVRADVTPSGGSQFTIPITLNSQFGGTGTSAFTGKQVAPPPGANAGSANAIGVDPNGHIYVAGPYVFPNGDRQFAVTKYDHTGQLVTAFDLDGTRTIDFGAGFETVNDMELIVAGQTWSLYLAGTSGSGWAVAKLDPTTGALDPNFGTGGLLNGIADGQLNAIHFSRRLDFNSGYLLLAGTSNSRMRVMAINPATGATAWSTSIVFDPLVSLYQEAWDVIEQTSDTKVVVAGWQCRLGDTGAHDFALARLNSSDGSLDTTFDGDGMLTTNFGCLISGSCSPPSADKAYALLESDDQTTLFAVGSTNYAGFDEFAVAAYRQSNGSRQPNFQEAGLPDGLATGPRGVARDAAIQYNTADQAGYAKIVAVGEGVPGNTGSDFVVARFQTAESIYFRDGTVADGGALDAGFASGGVATTDFAKSQAYTWGQDIARGVALAPQHSGSHSHHSYNIIVAGQSNNSSPLNIALAEYLPRNRVLVVSDSGPPGGGAPLTGGASDGGTAPGITFAVLDEDQDVLSAP